MAHTCYDYEPRFKPIHVRERYFLTYQKWKYKHQRYNEIVKRHTTIILPQTKEPIYQPLDKNNVPQLKDK